MTPSIIDIDINQAEQIISSGIDQQMQFNVTCNFRGQPAYQEGVWLDVTADDLDEDGNIGDLMGDFRIECTPGQVQHITEWLNKYAPTYATGGSLEKNYVIFDVNRPILEKDAMKTAKTPIEAVRNYLKENNIKGTPKRSASNFVTISAREFVYRDGVKYFTHKPTQWYEIVSEFATGGKIDSSLSEQKKWSALQSKMYDNYVNHSNGLVDLEEAMVKAKNRKDTDEIKRLELKKQELKHSIRFIEENFYKSLAEYFIQFPEKATGGGIGGKKYKTWFPNWRSITEKHYNALVAELEKKGIPCRVKLNDIGQIVVETGRDTPEGLLHKIDDAAEKVGIERNILVFTEVLLCAETSERGIKSTSIAGGPKDYYRGQKIGGAARNKKNLSGFMRNWNFNHPTGGYATGGRMNTESVTIKPYIYNGWSSGKNKPTVWVDTQYAHPDPPKSMIWGYSAQVGDVSDFKGFFEPNGPGVVLEYNVPSTYSANQAKSLRSKTIREYVAANPTVQLAKGGQGGVGMTCLASLLDSSKNKFVKTTPVTGATYAECEEKVVEMNKKMKGDKYWKITIINYAQGGSVGLSEEEQYEALTDLGYSDEEIASFQIQDGLMEEIIENQVSSSDFEDVYEIDGDEAIKRQKGGSAGKRMVAFRKEMDAKYGEGVRSKMSENETKTLKELVDLYREERKSILESYIFEFHYPKFRNKPAFVTKYKIDTSKVIPIGGVREDGYNLTTLDGKETNAVITLINALQAIRSGEVVIEQSEGYFVKVKAVKDKFATGGTVDTYDKIANEEFGMDYEQLGPNEKEWVRDEASNQAIKRAAGGNMDGETELKFVGTRNPSLRFSVFKSRDGRITRIENNRSIRFPFQVGQILNMGVKTWACNNHFTINGINQCLEEKIFGIRKRDIPQGHELRNLYPGKFKTGGTASAIDKNGLLYALQEFVSAGTVAANTSATTYDQVAAIRAKAIDLLRENGDQPYSLSALVSLLKQAENAIVPSDEMVLGLIDKHQQQEWRKRLGGNLLTAETGSKIQNTYRELSSAYELWELWSPSQRLHFLQDHRDKYGLDYELPHLNNIAIADLSFEDLPAIVQKMVDEHRIEGQYANGGCVIDEDGVDHYAAARTRGLDSQDFEAEAKEYAGKHWNTMTAKERSDLIEEMKYNRFATGGNVASKVFEIGEIVWDAEHKGYGVVLDVFEDGDVRLDSDGVVSDTYLHKLGSDEDSGEKIDLIQAMLRHKRLVDNYPDRYGRINYAKGGTLAEKTELLAKKFSKELLNTIGREKLLAVVEANKTESDKNICHSHDHCDANMVMFVTLKEMGMTVSNKNYPLINAAWEKAKANSFYTKRIPKSHREYAKEVDAYKWFVCDLSKKEVLSGFEEKSDAVDLAKDFDKPDVVVVISERGLARAGFENPKEKWKIFAEGGNLTETRKSTVLATKNKEEADAALLRMKKERPANKFEIVPVEYDWGTDYRVIETYEGRVKAKGGILSEDMQMAKSDVMKLDEYAKKISDSIKPNQDVEAWVISKISKVEQTTANVKHTLESQYPKLFATGGEVKHTDGNNVRMMCLHIGKYAKSMLKAIDNGVVFESWMKHELSIAGNTIDSVFHYLDYYNSGNHLAKGGELNNIEDWVEEKAETLLKYYLPGVNHSEMISQTQLKKIGDYCIEKEIGGDRSPQAFIDICFGSKFEQTENQLVRDYKAYIKFAESLCENTPFSVQALSSKDDNTIMFLFTDQDAVERVFFGNFAKGGEFPKEIVIDGHLRVFDKGSDVHLAEFKKLAAALDKVNGGSVFTQEFTDKYEIVKETFKGENAEQLLNARKKELKAAGFAVKSKKINFEDIARGSAYFLSAVKVK